MLWNESVLCAWLSDTYCKMCTTACGTCLKTKREINKNNTDTNKNYIFFFIQSFWHLILSSFLYYHVITFIPDTYGRMRHGVFSQNVKWFFCCAVVHFKSINSGRFPLFDASEMLKKTFKRALRVAAMALQDDWLRRLTGWNTGGGCGGPVINIKDEREGKKKTVMASWDLSIFTAKKRPIWCWFVKVVLFSQEQRGELPSNYNMKWT